MFRTGFEPDVHIESDRLVGLDRTLGRNRAQSDVRALSRSVGINLGGGKGRGARADIVSDPSGRHNRVLRLTLTDASPEGGTAKGRAQVDAFNIEPGLHEFTQSARVFFGAGFRQLQSDPDKVDWLTLIELWNNQAWGTAKYGFRISISAQKGRGASDKLHFVADSQRGDGKLVWRMNNPTTRVPIGRWCRLVLYFREGGAADGRLVLAIQPEGGRRKILYDVTGFTRHPDDPAPDGLTGFNPLKLYTSKQVMDFLRQRDKPLQVYWDDWTVYRGDHFGLAKARGPAS